MADLKIPPLVRQFGKIAPCWKQIDLEMLHKMSRQGKPLSKIANLLPCLWFFRSRLRESILRLYIDHDERVGRCVHENVGTGQITYLQHGESDLVLTDEELQEFSNTFSSLCSGLLGIPKRDREAILACVMPVLESVKAENEIKSRTVIISEPASPPKPRKRRER